MSTEGTLNKGEYTALAAALRLLKGGGTHSAARLFPGREALAARVLSELVRKRALVQATDDLYRVKDKASVAAILQDERAFCAVGGWSPTHAEHATPFLKKGSWYEMAAAIEPLLDHVGHAGVQGRFRITARRIMILRALATLPRSVVDGAESAGLSAEHGIALAKGKDAPEEALLALVALAASHGLNAEETGALAADIARGRSLAEAHADLFGADLRNAEAGEEGDDPGFAEVTEATLKAAAATLNVVVEIRDLLAELTPRIKFLSRELGYPEESEGA